MARPHLKISVLKPCSENWNTMTPRARGRFCESCATTVVDFSQLTDDQLKAYFLQHTGKTCGRFSSSQLERPFYLAEAAKPNFLVKAFASLALFMGLSSQVQAQSNPENQAPTHQLIQSIRGKKPKTVAKTPEKVSGDSLVISGKLVDGNTNDVLAFGNIIIKDTDLFTQSDSEGKFKFILPDTFKTKEIVLLVRYIGYQNKEHIISKGTESVDQDITINQDIVLELATFVSGGIVVRRTPGFYIRSLWWRAKSLFQKPDYEIPEE